MIRLAGALRWLGGWFGRGRRERELADELAFHLEMATEQNIARGMSAAEARRAALLAFGGVERFKEEARDARGTRLLENFAGDVRYAARGLRRAPGFTAAAVVTLGLGIGANSAIFSAVDAVLLRPPPFPAPGRLVLLWGQRPDAGSPELPISYPNFRDLREATSAFAGVAAWSSFEDSRLVLTGAGEPEQLRFGVASGDFFDVLGVWPVAGRTFTPADDEARSGPVVLVSEGLWRRRLGGEPGAVGRSLTLDGRPYTVVGVLPASFRFGGDRHAPDVWIPLGQDPAGTGPRSRQFARGASFLGVVARLRPGVGVGRAQADADAAAARLAERYPHFDREWRIRVVPLAERAVEGRRPTLLVLLAAVGCVLLIACANVANLLLARGTTRARELALRTALGAGRARIVVQLLTEAGVLALAGGALGLAAAAGLLRLLGHLDLASPSVFVPYTTPTTALRVDGRALAFTLALCAATTALAGLWPALHAARGGSASRLADGGRGSDAPAGRRTRDALVVAEIAVSLVLLAGAGLMLRTLTALRRVDPGFHAEHVLTAEVGLPDGRYADPDRVRAFWGALLERARALPGVRDAGAVQLLPLAGIGPSTDFVLEGGPPPRPGEGPEVRYAVATPGYVGALGIRVLRGRDFDRRDDERAARVALVSESMARHSWPGQDPIGKRVALSIEALRFRGDGPPILDFPSAYRTVVGVVADVRHDALSREPAPHLYLPLAQHPAREMTVVLRTTGDPAALAAALRRTVASIDPAQPVSDIRGMEDVVAQTVGQPRYRTLLLGLFGAVAALLAAIGLYGVLAYGVARRTREIGVRIALGATSRDVFRLVGADALRLAAAGLALGVAGALAATRMLSGLLFGVRAIDPLTFLAATAGLLAVAAAAAWLPARRAACVDPADALRAP
ncbi:MAG TPA: ABC transporter permease [Longimicrobiales bacterium]|nr:ABC transporter permease [Longimicrobiales bacterium]